MTGELNPAIERATRAAYEQFYTSEWPPKTFDSELRTADEWRSAMRAAILALREPTEAMLDAAPVIAGENPSVGEVWQAMIDEAAR